MSFSPYHEFNWTDCWFLLQGAGRTILLTLVAGTLATVLGVAVGWLRFASRAARILTTPAIDVLRSVPLLVLLILVSSVFGIAGFDIDVFGTAVAILTLYAAAFAAEVARAGFASVDRRTRRAARSLGMTAGQEARHVLLPLAARTVFPAWVSLMLALVKDSALVSAIGYVELLKASQVAVTQTNQPFLVFALSGLLYFAICYPCSVLSRNLEARMKHDLAA